MDEVELAAGVGVAANALLYGDGARNGGDSDVKDGAFCVEPLR